MRKLFTIRLDIKTLNRLKKIEGSKTEFVEKAILARLEWFEKRSQLEKSNELFKPRTKSEQMKEWNAFIAAQKKGD